MNNMFWQATSFKKQLCRAPWVNSKANKKDMFTGSASTVCAAPFTSNVAFKRAVVVFLKLSPKGNCPNGRHGPIGGWDVCSVTSMDKIFDGASSFDADISKWDVSGGTTMSAMFAGATLFNGDLSKWDVSHVADMSGMFWRASAFNGDISKWKVWKVNSMASIFIDATSFDGDLSKWDVSSVTTMTSMFNSVASFNGDISKWGVSKVTTMTSMFNSAISFNGDISKWDVSKVIAMTNMFNSATSFKQQLCRAPLVNSKASKIDMFTGSAGSIGWRGCTATTFASRAELKRAVGAYLKLGPKGDCSNGRHVPIGGSAGTICAIACPSTAELKRAVIAYLKLSPKGDCPNDTYGLIEEWDVSGVTDMDKIFDDASSFNG
jgi:surface protein